MHIINNANDLLNAMREGGFTVMLNGGFLEVQQSRWIDDELDSLIRIYKLDLIKILESEAINDH